MKKVLPVGESPFSPRTLNAVTRKPSPDQDGFASDWTPHFYGEHHCPLEEAGGETDSHAAYAGDGTLFRAPPPSASWVTEHRNGP